MYVIPLLDWSSSTRVLPVFASRIAPPLRFRITTRSAPSSEKDSLDKALSELNAASLVPLTPSQSAASPSLERVTMRVPRADQSQDLASPGTSRSAIFSNGAKFHKLVLLSADIINKRSEAGENSPSPNMPAGATAPTSTPVRAFQSVPELFSLRTSSHAPSLENLGCQTPSSGPNTASLRPELASHNSPGRKRPTSVPRDTVTS